MTKILHAAVLGASLLATYAVAAPSNLSNPLFTVKSCSSLEAQKTERCKHVDDVCTRKPGMKNCARYNALKQKYPFEKEPEKKTEQVELITGAPDSAASTPAAQ